MPAMKITQEHFASSGRLYGRDGLGAAIRGLAIDNARLKIMVVAIADFVDNSTGVSAGNTGLVDLHIPTAPFDATIAGGATRTAFNTAIGKVSDAIAVETKAMNAARLKIGLPVYTFAGTVAVDNTIPAVTKTVATTSGVTALDYAGGRASMLAIKSQMRKLAIGMNEVFSAVGAAKLPVKLNGPISGLAMAAVPAAAASTTGASAISKVDADDFLGDCADNIATLAAKWNAVMVQAGDTSGLNVIAG